MDLWTAFILGAIGSLHCAGMCGPLAAALPCGAPGKAPFLAGRLAYNAGRIVTYCCLGAIFGLTGKSLALIGLQRWLSLTLGVLLVAGLFASRRLAFWRPITALVTTMKAQMSLLLRGPSVASLGVLGALNGLLPCGLVYTACAGATATGAVLPGTAYMAVFGIGTVPMMLGIGISGKLLPMRFRLRLAKAIPASVFVLGALLILRGLALGIPYLSPDLAAGSCCH